MTPPTLQARPIESIESRVVDRQYRRCQMPPRAIHATSTRHRLPVFA